MLPQYDYYDYYDYDDITANNKGISEYRMREINVI